MASNQCARCLWFSPWEDLRPLTEEDLDEVQESISVSGWEIVQRWPIKRNMSHGTGTLFHHILPCAEYHKSHANPESRKKRKEAKCPQCGHGKNGRKKGHNGRRCWYQRYYRDYEGHWDCEECGCDYGTKRNPVKE